MRTISLILFLLASSVAPICLFGDSGENPHRVQSVLILHYDGYKRDGLDRLVFNFSSEEAWENLEVPDARWDRTGPGGIDLYFVFIGLGAVPHKRMTMLSFSNFTQESRGFLAPQEVESLRLLKGEKWKFNFIADVNLLKKRIKSIEKWPLSFDHMQFWPQPKDASFVIKFLREDQERLLSDIKKVGNESK